MAKGKTSSPSKKKRYALSPAVTKENKSRNVARQKRIDEKNANKVRNKVKGSHRSVRRSVGIVLESKLMNEFTIVHSEGRSVIRSLAFEPKQIRILHV